MADFDDTGADTTGGAGGSDTVAGGGGADTVAGGGGADTVAGGGGGDNLDWRADLAGDDKALLGFMGRYHSKDAFLKGFKSLNDDLKAGKFIKPLGEDASDEDKAAWAKILGVPDRPEAYLEKLPDGLVIGDDDKPFVDKFAQQMHAAGAPKAAVDAALQTYYDIVDDQNATLAEANAAAKTAAEDALRGEWGADYRRNVNALSSFVGALPDDVSNALVEAVGPDGSQIMNNPEVVKWLMGIALDKNPLATVVPGAGANQASAIAEEIATIEKTMRENRSAYNRDEKMQGRYRELLTAREHLKGQ